MLQLNGLKKQYDTGEWALKGIDLEIPNGQVIALIGPSGAGKSTLIRCVNRLVKPTSGTIHLKGTELTSLSSGALRNNMADKRADELSGGQRQRVGICRALIQDPDLLLVDEPTASLDPKTSRQIMRLINELCEERGLTAIINIHDVFLAQMFSQRIVGLELGSVVYDGAPEGLTPEVLTKIYGEEDWTATIETVEDDDENLTP
ncbi:MAG: phosphonate ABC transporter ATP-binding protein [Rhodobacterales bacterium]